MQVVVLSDLRNYIKEEIISKWINFTEKIGLFDIWTVLFTEQFF